MPNPAALIDPHTSDNSAETKQVTYYGEVADFIQFMTMTTFSDGVNTVARYGFGKENFIPVYGLVGMDIVSYSIMIALAYYREEKFLQRRDLFRDKNSAAYYRQRAAALLAALNHEERLELIRDKQGREAVGYITDLIKYNARLINSDNLPAARTVLDKWFGIFEKAKHRKRFANVYYNFHSPGLAGELAFISNNKIRVNTLKNIRVKYLERQYVMHVLQTYSERLITEQHAKLFIHELTLLEKTGVHDLENAQLALLRKFYVIKTESLNKARELIYTFYSHYHSYQDKNDLAFYRANMRGILQDERERTAFKAKLFGTVKNVSAVATVYSIGSFIASFFFALSTANILAPLYLVGATSLVDEWTDCNFKEKKLIESRADLAKWRSSADNQRAHAIFSGLTIQSVADVYAFSHHPDNRRVIWSYYLGAKKEGEAFDLDHFGRQYLIAKSQEHQDLTDRITRREIKYKQACMSFTGVFFGVLISMTVGILAMSMGVGQLTDILGFIGFGTIATAAFAGLYMIKYQSGQHHNKTNKAQTDRQTEIKNLETKHPLMFRGYPSEPKPLHPAPAWVNYRPIIEDNIIQMNYSVSNRA